ncbi:MAG: hypothetical protein WDN44_10550 [Sphingomonas sp.]
MFEFRQGAGAVVAADTSNTVAAMDDALLNGVRMCASIIEATQGSNLPAAHSQKLLNSMTAGLTQVVAGRGEIVTAIRQLTAIKGQSNFAPMDFGCPDGWGPPEAAAAEATREHASS